MISFRLVPSSGRFDGHSRRQLVFIHPVRSLSSISSRSALPMMDVISCGRVTNQVRSAAESDPSGLESSLSSLPARGAHPLAMVVTDPTVQGRGPPSRTRSTTSLRSVPLLASSATAGLAQLSCGRVSNQSIHCRHPNPSANARSVRSLTSVRSPSGAGRVQPHAASPPSRQSNSARLAPTNVSALLRCRATIASVRTAWRRRRGDPGSDRVQAVRPACRECRSTSLAACQPHMPCTPAPGGVELEHR